MNRLLYVIVLTPDLERMKRFYQDAVGLDVVVDSPAFVSFNTGGASLALIAIPRRSARSSCASTATTSTPTCVHSPRAA
jgi:catechol 2,3-dioxygenase-like lactoylglutathione lyase family enzyme